MSLVKRVTVYFRSQKVYFEVVNGDLPRSTFAQIDQQFVDGSVVDRLWMIEVVFGFVRQLQIIRFKIAVEAVLRDGDHRHGAQCIQLEIFLSELGLYSKDLNFNVKNDNQL